jgi:hypothetical protein
MTPIPTYQVMDYDGKILNAKEMPKDVRIISNCFALILDN